MPRFLKQEEITQYAVKNSCPDLSWNLYGFPMPQVSFKFEGQDIELGETKTFFQLKLVPRSGVQFMIWPQFENFY